MTREEVLETYDEAYARRYDATFLLAREHSFLAKTQLELKLLQRLTERARSWLDVACGTGYFLRHARGNPALECAGLDLSPAMIDVARARNPDAEMVVGDFLESRAEFVGRWEVTSCLWGAYMLQETLAEVEALVENLAAWTRPGGTCFTPVFDLDVLEGRRVAGVLSEGVEIDSDHSRWSFREPDGKRHRDMLAPPVSLMTSLFERHFETVEPFPYPVSPGSGDGSPIVGIIARRPAARG